jgi:hypothetical protein
MLLYFVCKAGEFVWNEGGVVPATTSIFSVFLNRRVFAHLFWHLDIISLMLPLFWVHFGYFEYENFSGTFFGAKILMPEVGFAN